MHALRREHVQLISSHILKIAIRNGHSGNNNPSKKGVCRCPLSNLHACSFFFFFSFFITEIIFQNWTEFSKLILHLWKASTYNVCLRTVNETNITKNAEGTVLTIRSLGYWSAWHAANLAWWLKLSCDRPKTYINSGLKDYSFLTWTGKVCWLTRSPLFGSSSVHILRW